MWKLEEDFLEEGSELEYVKSRQNLQIREFDANAYNWFEEGEDFIDLREEQPKEERKEGEEEGNEALLEIDDINLENKNDIFDREVFLGGKIGDLPEELLGFLREELHSMHSKEAFRVTFPRLPLLPKEAEEILSSFSPEKEELQHLFEVFRVVGSFATKKEQKKVLWQLFLSPEISSLNLEKKFGFFQPSHLRIVEASVKSKTEALPEGDSENASN